MIRVDTLEQLLDTAQVLAHQPLPTGRRVAIVGNAGGPGILAADACAGAGLDVPELSRCDAGRVARVRRARTRPCGNPVDLVAAASRGAVRARARCRARRSGGRRGARALRPAARHRRGRRRARDRRRRGRRAASKPRRRVLPRARGRARRAARRRHPPHRPVVRVPRSGRARARPRRRPRRLARPCRRERCPCTPTSTWKAPAASSPNACARRRPTTTDPGCWLDATDAARAPRLLRRPAARAPRRRDRGGGAAPSPTRWAIPSR